MRTNLLTLAVSGLVVFLAVSPAVAQSNTSAPGSVRGLFGGGERPNPARTSQQVSVWFDLGGGYDQNLDVSNSSGAVDVEGYATTVLGGFRFWRGRTTRSIEATARMYRNDQRAGRTTATGGEINVNSNVEFNRRTGMTLALRGANDSAVLFGAFSPNPPTTGPVDPQLDIPDVSPQQGVLNDRWYSLGGTASTFRNWNVRHRSTGSYLQVRRRPTEDDGLSSDQQQATLRHDWMFRMNFGLLGLYRFERVRQTLGDVPDIQPVRTQTLEGGLQWERRFSPVRALAATFQVGATQLLSSSTAGTDADGTVEPTGAFTASYAFTRRWSVAAAGTRSITVLQGTSQAPFTSDMASLSITGVLGRRITTAVTGSYSQGSSIGAAPGAFDAVGGTASVRYAFRYGGLFLGYTRYEHQLRDIVLAPGAIAPRFDQRSIRAGVTLWLPLFGAF